ncbi:hypothetical protein GGI02_004948, partial [Coemansia sp. RSA 2322]
MSKRRLEPVPNTANTSSSCASKTITKGSVAAPTYSVYRVDTNGVEHAVEGTYQTPSDAQSVADKYEQL